MRVYRTEYHEYDYRLDVSAGDWFRTSLTVKFVMADNSLGAADNLRANFMGRRIEVSSIDFVCKIDIKK